MAATKSKAAQAGPRELRERVAEVLATLRPAVQGDGGDIQLVDVTADGVATVRLLGACVGCPSAAMTMKEGVERSVKQAVPEIREVQCV
jgi:Fe-S cluster biogenesis protein NfuA